MVEQLQRGRGDGLHHRRRRVRVRRRPRSSTSPRTPAPRWPSTSCTSRAATRCACTTTCRSRPPRTASCRCWCAARRAARRTPATSSTATRRLLERSAKLAERWVIVDGDTDGANAEARLGRQQGGRPDREARAGRRGARSTSGRARGAARPGQARPEELPRPQDRQGRRHRRLADRAADHRDARRRSVGVHPDERDLDHRRPDLPAARPVQRRRAAGRGRRHLGQPRGRQRPDRRDEAQDGRRRSEARPRPVPRTGSVRPARHRARQGDAVAARPRLPHGRDSEAGRSSSR